MTDTNKRAFLRGKAFRHSPDVIRPPWSGTPSRFTELCTRCNKCIDACPENILFRGDGGYPQINFQQAECTFCADCASVCVDDVFQNPPLEPGNAWSVLAEISSTCLSLNAILCRTCAENCPADAITFKLRTGGIAEPDIRAEDCTGCGACLYVCPKNSVLLKYPSS